MSSMHVLAHRYMELKYCIRNVLELSCIYIRCTSAKLTSVENKHTSKRSDLERISNKTFHLADYLLVNPENQLE